MDTGPLRFAVKYLYDLQKLRIQQGNRGGKQGDETEIQLDDSQKTFMKIQAGDLKRLETDAAKEIKRLAAPHPIYQWLTSQKGIGPQLAGVIIAEIDIVKADTPSKIWAYCGMTPSSKRVKGEKLKYNPWLKSKLLDTLGSSFLKAEYRAPPGGYYINETVEEKKARKVFDPTTWGDFYRNYKNRKANCIVDVCPCCAGKGKYGSEKKECYVCDGGKKLGPYPWAKSDAHLHQASNRYMVKMFLREMWKEWRTLEGLDVRPPYEEEYLNRKHHAA